MGGGDIESKHELLNILCAQLVGNGWRGYILGRFASKYGFDNFVAKFGKIRKDSSVGLDVTIGTVGI